MTHQVPHPEGEGWQNFSYFFSFRPTFMYQNILIDKGKLGDIKNSEEIPVCGNSGWNWIGTLKRDGSVPPLPPRFIMDSLDGAVISSGEGEEW